MPIYKRCTRCGKRLLSGTNCECQKKRHKEYDRYSRDRNAKAFYGSRLWEKTREEVLELDGGIDVYLFMTEGIIAAADTVHHIVPLRDDWARRADKENLMSLSHDTHSMIEQKYKENKDQIMEELKEMLAKYREEMR